MKLDEVIKEVGREIGMRKGVYPKWVANGRMKQDDADRQLAAMEEAHRYLQCMGRFFEDLKGERRDAGTASNGRA